MRVVSYLKSKFNHVRLLRTLKKLGSPLPETTAVVNDGTIICAWGPLVVLHIMPNGYMFVFGVHPVYMNFMYTSMVDLVAAVVLRTLDGISLNRQ